MISKVCPSMPWCAVIPAQMNLGLVSQARHGDLLRRWMFGAITIAKIEQASDL